MSNQPPRVSAQLRALIAELKDITTDVAGNNSRADLRTVIRKLAALIAQVERLERENACDVLLGYCERLAALILEVSR